MEPATARRALRLLFAAGALAAGCSSGDSPSEPPPGPARFVVEVAGSERFTLQLEDPERIAEAERHLASGRDGVIGGALAAGSGGFNAPYSWHLVPSTVQFPDVAIELCDGLPSHVEADLAYWLGTVGQYCPWSARIVARSS